MEGLAKHPRRRAHFKVKTGCPTCKVRRIKCGEERPSCRRCLISGLSCDGYGLLPKTTQPIYQSRPGVAALMPRSYQTSLLLAPSSSRFDTDEQRQYFDIFGASTAYEIFPCVEQSRLRLMFLQAAESEPTIRHAAIALGALDKTSQLSQYSRSRSQQRDGMSASHHYHRALEEYSRTLKFAQTSRKIDLRTALMTSLAILSFEGWFGNHESALNQIMIGMRLMKEWDEQNRRETVPTYTTPAPPQDVQEVLFPVYGRLRFQLASSAAAQSPASSLISKPLPDDCLDVERIPETFKSLEEAGGYHNAITNLLVRFVSKGHPPITRAGRPTQTYPVYVFSVPLSQPVIDEQQRFVAVVYGWIAAFRPLKAKIERKGASERKMLLTMEMRMKSAIMSVVTACAENESVYDNYLDLYKDIIDLSEALLNSSPDPDNAKVPKFCFDIGVVIHLWSIGLKCRDPSLRRRVISLLVDFPRREGHWDSVSSGKMIESVMHCEEEFVVNGHVPEWARIRYAIFGGDTDQHKVVEFQQGMSAQREEMVTRRISVFCHPAANFRSSARS